MLKDFIAFLKEYNVVSLGIAFVMGTATTTLVGSLVKDVLMPMITSLLSTESWKTATLHIGRVGIGYGAFLAELLNFIIITFVIFLVAKKILRDEKKKK